MHSLQVVHMSMQRYDLCWMHYSYSTLPNTLLNFLEVLFCFNFHNFLWQLYLTAFVICIVNVYACITKITSRKNDFDFNGGLWLWKVVSELGKRSNIIIISQSISHPAYSGYGMKQEKCNTDFKISIGLACKTTCQGNRMSRQNHLSGQ